MDAHIEVEDREVFVGGDPSLDSRHCRRFFRSVLGGTYADATWRIPLRSRRAQDIVVRVDTFLRSNGFDITRGDFAERSVELALERRRAIERSREAAIAWRDGTTQITDADVHERLRDTGWSSDRTLRPHQARNVTHGLAAINQANFSVPGAGKTATALATAWLHMQVGTIDLVVVVGPLACFEPWESETRAAVGDQIVTRRVRGPAHERRRLYADATAGGILLLSYATAAADRPAIKEMCERLNVMLIVDESHRIKRFVGGVWAPALIEIAELARVRMILSGTPMPNGARDLFTQLNVLWPNGLLTGSRSDYANRVDRGFATVLPAIRPFTVRTTKSELGLPPYQVVRHEVPMQGLQEEVYDMIANRLRDAIDEAGTWTDKLEALRTARPVRLLQAASNPDLLNHPDEGHRIPAPSPGNLTLMDRLARYSDEEVPCKSVAAIELLRGLAADGHKAVCWSNFLRNLDGLRDLVTDLLGVPVFQVDGRVAAGDDPGADRPNARDSEDDTRERRIESFLSMEGPAVLIANPATCSESISLHRACRHAIYLDRTYDAALFLQSIDRVHRLGLPPDAEVVIHLLLATRGGDPTIDHLVDASLLFKQAAMEELLQGAEIHPLEQTIEDAEGDDLDLEVLLRFLIGEENDLSEVDEV